MEHRAAAPHAACRTHLACLCPCFAPHRTGLRTWRACPTTLWWTPSALTTSSCCAVPVPVHHSVLCHFAAQDKFEDVAGAPYDMVVDTISGDYEPRSFKLLKKEGYLAAISPDASVEK